MPANRKSRRKTEKNEAPKVKLKEKVTEILELPKEVVLNIPKLTFVGNRSLVIENYKGIIEYDFGKIRVNTGIGIVKIMGNGLTIKEITSEDIMVEGDIETFEFMK